MGLAETTKTGEIQIGALVFCRPDLMATDQPWVAITVLINPNL